MFRRVLALAAVCILAFSFFPGSIEAGQAKKAVFVIAAKNFQDQEFSRPYAVLLQKGVAITVASTVEGEAVAMNGSKARVDVQLSQVQARDYDAVIFIGGSGTTQYVDDPVAHKLAYDAVKERKVVGAICMAPLILAKAGLLKGRKATVYPALADDFKQYGMKYTAKSVEKDGRIITADGPDSAQAFGEELARFF